MDVTTDRSVYKAALNKAKSLIVAHFSSNGEFSPPSPGAERPSNATPIEAHYSFDMAQQVFISQWPSLQPGPMYFLTPCKCAIFWVCCEAIPHQINYLIDEAVDMGKGSNAIVSTLHHYFKHHGLGERKAHLHADNCGGLNKNATIVHYLLWRVMTRQHDELSLSFMIPGHTKFSLDWCFSLMKKQYRWTKVGGLTDLIDVVNQSAVVNVAHQQTGKSLFQLTTGKSSSSLIWRWLGSRSCTISASYRPHQVQPLCLCQGESWITRSEKGLLEEECR